MFVVEQQSGCVDSCCRRLLMSWTSIAKVGLLCQMTTCLLSDDLEVQTDMLRSDSCSARPMMKRMKTTFRLLASQDCQLEFFSLAAENVWMHSKIQ